MDAFRWGATAFLLLYNNTTALVRMPGWLYVVMNGTLAAGALAGARAHGVPWAGLGFGSGWALDGLRWGLPFAAAIAAGLAVAPLLRAGRRALDDRRVTSLPASAVAFHALVRIPIGTALWEEVAFRSVLFGVWDQDVGRTAAVLVSSVAFGIWHIGPTLETARVNGVVAGRGLIAAGGVLATAVAGVALAWLRLRGGVLACIIVHAAANSLALATAARVGRRA